VKCKAQLLLRGLKNKSLDARPSGKNGGGLPCLKNSQSGLGKASGGKRERVYFAGGGVYRVGKEENETEASSLL